MKVIPSPGAIVNLLQSSQQYMDLENNTLFVSVVIKLWDMCGETGVQLPQNKMIFRFFKSLRPSTRFTQHPIQWVLGSFYP
jgi:hypothetical protein